MSSNNGLLPHHFKPQKTVIVEPDASDFALGAVLSQRDEENRLHPVENKVRAHEGDLPESVSTRPPFVYLGGRGAIGVKRAT